MVPANIKWIEEQVLEGKRLVDIDFGEVKLNSDQKLELIDLALKHFPNPPFRFESEIEAIQEELDMIPRTTSGTGITRLIIHPLLQKQDLFLPLEASPFMKNSAFSRMEFRVTHRARRYVHGNPSGVIMAVRRGWKNSLALARQEA